MNDRAPIEIRSAEIAAVDYPARTIELIAVPYDSWATVNVAGRTIEESFAPGSFGAVDKRAQRNAIPTVNLEHDPQRFVGRVRALHPDDPAGLRAELLIRRGKDPLFDQVLNDCADGMYAASVGFSAEPADQEWDERRTRRRITLAYLDHIALTTAPAFAGTKVLAVRSAPDVQTSATPNLDRILSERRAQAYDLA